MAEHILELNELTMRFGGVTALEHVDLHVERGEILGYNLANLPSQFEPAKYERMVFGIILILMMIYRPEGIIPARRRRLETFHPDEERITR